MPTYTPTPTLIPTPTASPTLTDVPTPSRTPTPAKTPTPTTKPSATPTYKPSSTPTLVKEPTHKLSPTVMVLSLNNSSSAAVLGASTSGRVSTPSITIKPANKIVKQPATKEESKISQIYLIGASLFGFILAGSGTFLLWKKLRYNYNILE